MFYAKVFDTGRGSFTISGRYDQPDTSWQPFDVSDHTWLYLDASNNIQIYTQGQMTSNAAMLTREQLISDVEDALYESERLATRIFEATVLGDTTMTSPDVVAFMQYRKSLRNILNGTDTTSTQVPAAPPTPAGI